MEEDDFSFDFESKLEEQQKLAAAAPGPVRLPGNAAVPVNQSAGSFKRNYRQVGNPRTCPHRDLQASRPFYRD